MAFPLLKMVKVSVNTVGLWALEHRMTFWRSAGNGFLWVKFGTLFSLYSHVFKSANIIERKQFEIIIVGDNEGLNVGKRIPESSKGREKLVFFFPSFCAEEI